jgi:hypothetical protein
MYFVANNKLTTFVLKMIKKEEKRRVSILKRQMVVSKRVERARERGGYRINNFAALIIHTPRNYCHEIVWSFQSKHQSAYVFILTLKDNETLRMLSSLQG